MRPFTIIALLLIARAVEASGPAVQIVGAAAGEIPQIEVPFESSEPINFGLSLGNFSSDEPITVVGWQLAVSIVPAEGAQGSLILEKVTIADPPFLGDKSPDLESPFELLKGLGTSSAVFQEFDPSGIGATIPIGADARIAHVQVSNPSQASGTFIVALVPFDLESADDCSSWIDQSDYELKSFDNVVGTANAIELARIHVQSAVSVEGDFNGDLVVDAADYTFWRDRLGAPGFEAEKYAIWRQHFGAWTAALNAGGAIPEPLGLFAYACGAIASLSLRRVRPGS